MHEVDDLSEGVISDYETDPVVQGTRTEIAKSIQTNGVYQAKIHNQNAI